MTQKQTLTELPVQTVERDPSKTAAYIEELVRELEGLARKDEIQPLEKILRLAHQEARRVATS